MGCGEPASLNLQVLGSGRFGLYEAASEIPQGLQFLAFIEFRRLIYLAVIIYFYFSREIFLKLHFQLT